MNVTRENFQEAAAQIEALLPSAAFVAFDEEMTGISIAGQTDSMGDTPAMRYSKMRKVASRYNIIQFGLAVFHEKPSAPEAPEGTETYEAHVFNFYVFPEKGPVNMDGSAVQFNVQHGMDWNKWIREGIPYVNRDSAKKLRDAILPSEAAPAKEKKEPGPRMVLTKETDIQIVGDAIAALKLWLADETKNGETEFEVIETNAYLRRYMYETLGADYTDLIVESRTTPKRALSKMFVLRLSDTQKAERVVRLQLEKEAQVAQKVGFRRVWSALADAKKPVVGHAVMYDMLFALSHFESSLPESYAEYKALVQGLFPSVFDTQFLAKSEPFKFLPQAADAEPGSKRENRFGSMALGQVYKVFELEAESAKSAGKPTVSVSFAPGHDRYGPDCTAFHEAGYDAYVTGYAFAHMAKQALSAELLSSVNSRTTMFRSLYHFNWSGDDDLVAKGIYVFVRGLKGRNEKYLKTAITAYKAPASEVCEVLSDTDIDVKWIDDDSAFIVLAEKRAGLVSAMLGDAKDSMEPFGADGGLKLTSFNEWLSAQNAVPSSEEVKEPDAKRARLSA